MPAEQDNQPDRAARDLGGRIRELALKRDYPALLEIGADPATRPLLDRLPREHAAAATIHLEAARRWREQRRSNGRRKLEEARSALDRLDLTLARALLERLEDAYLTTDDLAERDSLLLELEARAIESEELSEAAGRLDRELPRRRWWRGPKR